MVVITEELHARVIRGSVQSGQAAAGRSIIADVLVPALMQIPGYRGCDLLGNGIDFELCTWWSFCPGGTEPAFIDKTFGEMVEKFAAISPAIETHVRYTRTMYHRMGEDTPLPPID